MDTATQRLMSWVVRTTQHQRGDLPVFPHVATRVVDQLEQPGVSIGDIESLVAQDPVITAELLRTANSVIFGGAIPVESVGPAVMRLGFRETANVAMTAACRCLFDVEDRAELGIFPDVWEALWHDSLVCAYGSRLLARELKRGDPERIFLGSMFRNVGGLQVLKIVARGLVMGRLATPPPREALERVFAALHGELGANYLRGSRMPRHVIDAAEKHHAALLPFNADTVDLHVIRLADGLCDAIGVAPFATGTLSFSAEQAAELLEVDAPRLEYFELQFQSLAEQLREFL